MTITYPRALANLCSPVSGSTDPKRFQTSAADGEGGIGSVDVAPMIWMSQYNFTARGRDEIAQWDAWKTSLRGGMRTFQMIPIRDGRKLYRWPLTRPRGFDGLTVSGSPWGGSGALASIGTGRDTVTIDEMPNGLVLSYGDYFSFSDGSINHLHMILEGSTVSGNSISLTVEPTIRQGVTESPALEVSFERPWCHAFISGEVSKSGDMAAMTFSFLAYQKPR